MAPTAAGTPPASSIYIGNSFFYFNNGITSHMAQLIAQGMPGLRHRQTMVTISGSGFDWHDVESYFRPNALGKYSFDASNNVVFNKIDRLFEVAVMMDCSQCPVHPQLKEVFKTYAKSNSETVRRNGHASAPEQALLGLNALAAPVCNANDEFGAAAAIGSCLQFVPADPDAGMFAGGVEMAREWSRTVGHGFA